MPKQTQSKPQQDPDLKYVKVFATSELPLAAFVRSRYKLPLVDVKKSSTGKVVWSFQLMDKEESVLVHDFHTGGLVEAAQFFSELRNLKAMTYST